ncbi:MAG TPA: hypothetical protein VE476_01105 [Propionibacteriaceae bacterium]|nr:hypothetical protein [Propionibacteriaceae bacterium]
MTSSEPKITTEIIGPEEAQDILDNHNARNRSLSMKTVQQYARAMKLGAFPFIADPIRFDRNGNLLDGQHRLAAVVMSECPQTFVIARNLDRDWQKYMDSGRKRSVADQLRIEGMPRPTVAASIARFVMHWQNGDVPGLNIKFSTAEVVDFVENNLDRIEAASTHAQNLYRATRTSQAISGAAYYTAREVADVALADEFMNQLVSGAGLATDSPILMLRNKLIYMSSGGRKVDRPELAYFYARAWNGWRRNEKLSKLQLPVGGTLNAAHLRMHP